MRTKILLFILCWLLGSGLLAHSQAPPAMPPEKVATVLGQRIYFHEAGQGSAVILLHGLGTSSEIWAQNIGPLSAQYHVYAPDQIGFGHSDKPLLDYTIGTFVDFLEGFMQTQQIRQATLVGSSLGGWIAIDFALRHPEMVSKLVLVNSAGLPFDQPPGVELNPSSLAGMRQVLEAIFYNKQMVNNEFARYAFTKHMQDNDGYTIQRTLAGFTSKNQFEDKKLASIHTPTLVIWGRDDELIPLATGEQLQKGIPGAKLVVVDRCGHFPHVEKASEFNQKVLQFLAGQEQHSSLLPQ